MLNYGSFSVFVVENNGYSMGTAAARHTVAEIVDRAKGYAMKSAVINGMDVFSVYEKMKEIADDTEYIQNHGSGKLEPIVTELPFNV